MIDIFSYLTPERYRIAPASGLSGDLTFAELKLPSPAEIDDFTGGRATTILRSPPRVLRVHGDVELYRYFNFDNNQVRESVRITTFSLAVSGTTVVWTFDYSFDDSEFIGAGGWYLGRYQVRYTGTQTGTLSTVGNQMTISWNPLGLTGNMQICETPNGLNGVCVNRPLTIAGGLGTWTATLP